VSNWATQQERSQKKKETKRKGGREEGRKEGWLFLTNKLEKCKRMGSGGVAQVVLHLPSKFEALSSNSSTEKKKEEEEEVRRRR
jgi:hypothetical protein